MTNWRPSADSATLRARAWMFQTIRAFLDARGVLEVDMPVLSQALASDPELASFAVETTTGTRHLVTSPEFAMKRLLAAGSGPIYQLGHVFRADEAGRWHNPEFTMLEWYRPGVDYHALMDEVAQLIAVVAPQITDCANQTFAKVLASTIGVNPLTAETKQLRQAAQQHGWAPANNPGDNDVGARAYWLDLIMGIGIGPTLGHDKPCFVYDYPVEQAMLTQIRDGSPPVAERFELYWQGVELANGGNELTDADALMARNQQDQQQRKAAGQSPAQLDPHLLAAMQHDLPPCAGVALGVDRLLALSSGHAQLARTLPFAWGNA